MADRVAEDAWSARLAAQVGQTVKSLREQRQPRLSAQQLADRTAEIGHEVPRSVIANLESGRRGVITVPDVLVLARALDVPPMYLLLPPQSRSIEVLPGRATDYWEAVEWIAGLDALRRAAPWAKQLDDDRESRHRQQQSGRPFRLHQEARNANRNVAGHSLYANMYRDRAAAATGDEQARWTAMADREAELATRSLASLTEIESELRELGFPALDLSRQHQPDEPFEPIEIQIGPQP